MDDPDDPWVCSHCGFDYCVCNLPAHPLSDPKANQWFCPGIRVRRGQLDLKARIRHAGCVLATIREARASQHEIDAMQAELDRLLVEAYGGP